MNESLIRHQTQHLIQNLKSEKNNEAKDGFKENRVTVKCDKIVKEKAEDWLNDENSNANEIGLYSIGDIVSVAVREFLERNMIVPEIPSHFILPNLNEHDMTLDFDVYDQKVICNMCNSETCVHIKRLHSDKIVKKYLAEHYKKRKERRDQKSS